MAHNPKIIRSQMIFFFVILFILSRRPSFWFLSLYYTTDNLQKIFNFTFPADFIIFLGDEITIFYFYQIVFFSFM
jgi:hypothetical protein